MRTVDSRRIPRNDHPIPAQSSPTTPVRVLIVDDERYFQDVVRELIDATSGFECIGSACSGEEGIDEADRLRPDLVLMDVRMPGIGGMEAARRMNARGNPAIVVLVSAEEGLADGSRGGASEVVPKRKLCRSLLRRLWEERGQTLAETRS
ncbi:MAG TPA: response regulator [Solirubrobacteraceae bacterium]|nr:response regulator [Solirubrobacteraceae bacterium]